MATDQRSLPAFFSNSADFQTWVQGLHNQLVAIGLTQGSDTGQINPASVSQPGSINTTAGFEIWRFSDTLQATVPVFIKVEYGVGAAVDRPSLWLTVGSTTNGTGTLGGQVGQRKQFAPSASKSSGVTLTSSGCSDGSGMVLMTNFDAAATGFVFGFAVDRTRDGSSAATADGVVFWGSSLGAINGAFWQVIPASGAIAAGAQQTGATAGWTFSANFGSGTFGPVNFGGNVVVVPYMAVCGKLLFSKMLHAVPQASLSVNVPVSFSTLGGSHTYLPFSSSGVYTITGNSGDAVCVLWE